MIRKNLLYKISLRLTALFIIYGNIGYFLFFIYVFGKKWQLIEFFIYPSLLILSIIGFIAAIGLFMLKESARKILIWIYCLWVLFSIFVILLPMIYRFRVPYNTVSYKTVFDLISSIFIVFFLTREGVKEVTTSHANPTEDAFQAE